LLLLPLKPFSYPLEFQTPNVTISFAKATQGVVNGERIIKQPWESDFQLTIIHPNIFS